MEISDFLDLERPNMCRLAILLAMTRTDEEEKAVIALLQEHHIQAAATTIFGYNITFEEKMIRSVVNLCLHTRLIERKRSHIHPVVHCVLEAAQSTRAAEDIGQNFKFKTAAVRQGEEFSLCFYGDLGMHPLSSHKSVGVGYQILGV